LGEIEGGILIRKKRLSWIFLIVIIGALLGSALGEVLGLILPEGVVREFFLRAAQFQVGQATLNLIVFTITVGFSIKINVIGVLGFILAAYFLRWIE
jgi:membrane protein YqaA with SNARE-associated domain